MIHPIEIIQKTRYVNPPESTKDVDTYTNSKIIMYACGDRFCEGRAEMTWMFRELRHPKRRWRWPPFRCHRQLQVLGISIMVNVTMLTPLTVARAEHDVSLCLRGQIGSICGQHVEGHVCRHGIEADLPMRLAPSTTLATASLLRSAAAVIGTVSGDNIPERSAYSQ